MNKILFFTISLIFSVVQESIAQKNNWISLDYVYDMKNKLPCDCMDSVSSCFYITMNDKIEKGDEYSVILNSISQMEPNYFKVVDIVDNKFEIEGFDALHKDVVYEVILVGDTLHLFKENSISKFIKAPTHQSREDNKYLLDNLLLFNRALEVRGYQSIDKLLNIESKNKLGLSCEAWWDDKNLLHVDGEPLYWLLRIEAGYLIIDKVLNPFHSPFVPLQTEMILRIEWKNI